MANVSQNHDEVLAEKRLRKQLAVAVRSVQWSYAIFWSLSKTEQGSLEWHEGYYNGDIKTRKTVQAMELKADKIGLQRSEQLRDLYKSLLEDDQSTDQQAKKNSPALSPEDLSDAEWFYLVCMSFVFKPGQDLPGQALANGQTVWLCYAQYADSKVFSRSLLAKSASIQTVVCFPYLGGVIEIGVTDQVSEDLNLLQHIKASLLDFSKPVCYEKSSHRTDNGDDEDHDEDQICAVIDRDMVGSLEIEDLCSLPKDIRLDQRGSEKYSIESPDECSKGCEHNHQTEDSFMLGGFECTGASQVHSWNFTDEDFSSGGVKDSVSARDCISEAFADKNKNRVSPPRHGNVKPSHFRELEKSNHTKLGSLDLGASDDDLHYKRTVAAVLGGSSQLTEHRCSCESDNESSFMAWKRGSRVEGYSPRTQQKMLKKILLSVPLMYGNSALESPNKDLEIGSIGDTKYGKSNESENFLVLRTIVPSNHKTGQETVLNDTIKYLKELEARVQELESCSEAKGRKKSAENSEQISDNCCEDKKVFVDEARKAWINKRKASDIEENNPVQSDNTHKDGLCLDLKVRVKDQEVLIDMKCPYKEYLLLDIMDTINHLHLDSHSVQSSTLDGVFTLTLKSKFRGTAIAPVGMIKQALWKVAGKC